jgi:hypothetical protein
MTEESHALAAHRRNAAGDAGFISIYWLVRIVVQFAASFLASGLLHEMAISIPAVTYDKGGVTPVVIASEAPFGGAVILPSV